MISTTALLLTAFEMLLASTLNVPHCLQASIEMTTPAFHGAGEEVFLKTRFFALTDTASFFLGGDLTDMVEVRVACAMVDKSRSNREQFGRTTKMKAFGYY